MKTLILIIFILLIFALFIAGNLLIEYIQLNDEIKEKNWDLIQDNRHLEQLLNACVKKLREYKTQ